MGIAGTDSEAQTGEALTALTLGTWNLQALFDGQETGLEYDEYLNSAGWSAEKYQARLTALAQAIGKMADHTPDVLAFQEVENGEVLKDLVEGPLAQYGYRWTGVARTPGASLGIGVISRLPLGETKAHSITYHHETTPRPGREVWLLPGKEDLVLFICHWKSKLGGGDETEPLRRAAARVILRRLREIGAAEGDVPAIILGDLNENHDEFYRRAGSVVSALLPDDPKAAEFSGFFRDEEAPALGSTPDFLVISRQKPPQTRFFSPAAAVLYSPWGTELQKGSYNYQNEWETIDHTLLSRGLFDQRGWEFDSCEAESNFHVATALEIWDRFGGQLMKAAGVDREG
jgi:endonuclease/exonuclease/phosphatase family metal-dependent hydrolase